jgi:tRNA G37 N-methylase Trm5
MGKKAAKKSKSKNKIKKQKKKNDSKNNDSSSDSEEGFLKILISQEIQNLKICKHVESIETQSNLKIPEYCPFCKPNQVISN